jgi:hypothetical protein
VGDAGEPAFQNSWVNFNTSTHPAAQFTKDNNGWVHLDGLVKSGAVTAAIFTLPAGYRPDKIRGQSVPSNSVFGYVEIVTDGVVKLQSGNNAWAYLTGISFYVGW